MRAECNYTIGTEREVAEGVTVSSIRDGVDATAQLTFNPSDAVDLKMIVGR